MFRYEAYFSHKFDLFLAWWWCYDVEFTFCFSFAAKQQRHLMTHVEIWAGDGPKTIGARWNNGKVQTFDHYKFTAKSFHSERYYFKSIDNWLNGICKRWDDWCHKCVSNVEHGISIRYRSFSYLWYMSLHNSCDMIHMIQSYDILWYNRAVTTFILMFNLHYQCLECWAKVLCRKFTAQVGWRE